MGADICFLTYRNIFDTPSLPKYENIIKGRYDIIYFDRYDIEEKCEANRMYRFRWYMNPAKKDRVRQLFGYLRFKHYAIKIIRTNKYRKIIVLPTQTGMFFSHFLQKNYKNNYALDIRDYAGERHMLIRIIEENLVRNSGLASITSPAYTRFLPTHDYMISHNIQPMDTSLISRYRTRERNVNKPITIAFIGTIRFIEQLKNFITVFKNDERFILCFAGNGSDLLQQFCDDINVKNVRLIPRFDRKDIGELYFSSDIAMNIYGNNNPYLDYALSNKLYSAAMIGMPILVSPDTYMEEIVNKYGFGYSIDLNDPQAPDKVFTYYSSIDREKLLSGCDDFLLKVMNDEHEYQKAIEDFLVLGE